MLSITNRADTWHGAVVNSRALSVAIECAASVPSRPASEVRWRPLDCPTRLQRNVRRSALGSPRLEESLPVASKPGFCLYDLCVVFRPQASGHEARIQQEPCPASAGAAVFSRAFQSQMRLNSSGRH